MERQTKQSADIPKWSALLAEAVNKPGLIMKAYSAFHQYSNRQSTSCAGAMPNARITARPDQYVSKMEGAWTVRHARRASVNALYADHVQAPRRDP